MVHGTDRSFRADRCSGKRKHKDYIEIGIHTHNPAWDGNDVVDEHNNLWPIPNTFLDKLQNAEEFGQNPGYDPYVRNQ